MVSVQLPFPPGFGRFLFRIYKAGGVYGYLLKKNQGIAPAFSPSQGRTGDRQQGVKIINAGLSDNFLFDPSDNRDWHGWQWMADLASVGTPEAQDKATSLALQWVREFAHISLKKLDPEIWEKQNLAPRICQFIYAWHPLLSLGKAGEEEQTEEQEEIKTGFARQLFHLANLCLRTETRFEAIYTFKALILACLTECLEARQLPILEEKLARFIDQHQLPDGGTIDRNPEHSALFLEHLSDLRIAYDTSQHPLPGFLQQALDRTAAFMQYLKFSNGRIPHFQGAENKSDFKLDKILQRSGYKGSAALSAPHSGYYKINAGATELILDYGQPPGERIARKNYHASIAAFELYIDRRPLIVNCGDVSTTDKDWSLAQRGSSAHSTAIIAEANQMEITPGGIGWRPTIITHHHKQVEEGSLLSVTHDGYEKNFGYHHHRKIFIYTDGRDIRGHDEFKRTRDTAPPQNSRIRFHLHPGVKVSLLQNKTSALLKLPNGQGWRLRTDGAGLAVEGSYFCDLGLKSNSKQIVLSCALRSETTVVKWAFKMEAA